MTFDEKEALNIHQPYDDAIMIEVQVAIHMVYWVLVDNMSFVDILYESTYNEQKPRRESLRLVRVPF